MQTSYVSDPPLSTADIINLIARGQTAQQAAASPSNLGASSQLAQRAASQVSSGVQKLVGLSSLSIDPTLGRVPRHSRSGIAEPLESNPKIVAFLLGRSERRLGKVETVRHVVGRAVALVD
jgi:hypothetical protein